MMHGRIALMGMLILLISPVVTASGSGGAPNAMVEVVIKGFGVGVVTLVFVYTILCFIRSGENDSRHIKHRILRDDW